MAVFRQGKPGANLATCASVSIISLVPIRSTLTTCFLRDLHLRRLPSRKTQKVLFFVTRVVVFRPVAATYTQTHEPHRARGPTTRFLSADATALVEGNPARKYVDVDGCRSENDTKEGDAANGAANPLTNYEKGTVL